MRLPNPFPGARRACAALAARFRPIITKRRNVKIAVSAALAASAASGAYHYIKNKQFGELFPRVPPRHVGILLRKHGRPLPPGQLVAKRTKPGGEPWQGVQEDVLLPGWYPAGYSFTNYDWWYVQQTTIPQNSIGVLIRQFGEDLPDGQILADENPADEAQGIVRRGPPKKLLEPGLYPINTYAYEVRIFPKFTIEPGQAGVVCNRYGPLPANLALFTSEKGERGVQKTAKTPGLYAINPFAEELKVVSRQSKKLDLGLAGRVKFPSSDGFDIAVTGTVEWSLKDSDVPIVFVKFSDPANAEKKLLLPAARAKSRIQGSRKPAREFISGATRQVFQDEFAKDLRSVAEPEGLKIHSVLISGITPPDEIAKPIRDREISLLDREQYQKQMSTERGRAEFVRESERQKRPQILATERSKAIEVVTRAQREQEVELIKAQNELDVAKLDAQAAQKQAEAATSTGMANAEVKKYEIDAESAALRARVDALGGGSNFARAALVQAMAPKLAGVLARPDSAFVTLFQQILKTTDSPQTKQSGALAEEMR